MFYCDLWLELDCIIIEFEFYVRQSADYEFAKVKIRNALRNTALTEFTVDTPLVTHFH